MKALSRFIFTGTLIAMATVAHGHPGHDLLENGPAHAVTSADHLLVIAAAGLTLAALASSLRTTRWRVVARYSSVTTAAFALAVWLLH